jgi:hypothetical protein
LSKKKLTFFWHCIKGHPNKREGSKTSFLPFLFVNIKRSGRVGQKKRERKKKKQEKISKFECGSMIERGTKRLGEGKVYLLRHSELFAQSVDLNLLRLERVGHEPNMKRRALGDVQINLAPQRLRKEANLLK